MVHQTTGRWRLGLSLALVATLFWGTLPIALKIVVSGMGTKTVIFYRFAVAAVVLGPFLARRSLLRQFTKPGPRSYGLLALAVAGFTANNLVFLYGLSFISPSAAQVVIQLAPMFLLAGAVLLYRERFAPAQWVGFGTLIMGLLVFFHDRVIGLVSEWGSVNKGLVLIVVSALCWACYALAQKGLLAVWQSGTVMWIIYVAGFFALLPFAHPFQLAGLGGFRLLMLAYCGVNTVVSYGCFAEALAHWEASRVSAVIATTPLITVSMMKIGAVWAPVYLQPEGLDAINILGALLVVLGSIVAAVAGSRRRPAG